EAPPAYTVQLHTQLREPARPLVRDERRRRQRPGRCQLEADMDVVTFDDVSRGAVAANLRRPGRDPYPGDGERDREHEPGRDRIERPRAEYPRREIDEEAEGENCAPALGQWSLPWDGRVSGARKPSETRTQGAFVPGRYGRD